MSAQAPPPSSSPTRGSVSEVFLVFLRLGLTSFGGPVAHLGYFFHEIVERRRWIAPAAYADLVALCQFLPGPASSQVGFALGYLRAGWAGAFAAWFGFTMPSAVLMTAAAIGLAQMPPQTGWLAGLKLAAVAVVAHAVWGTGTKLCPDRPRATLALLASSLVLIAPSAWMQVAVIAAGLCAGWLLHLQPQNAPASPESTDNAAAAPVKPAPLAPSTFSLALLAACALLLVGLPLATVAWPDRWLQLADAFYRAGALVFGGGHVVLPLLEQETVGRGWLDRDTFLAGYGLAQAVPGPLFTFAAYLGAAMQPETPWLTAMWCLIWILAPSFLLVLGVLPFWDQLRAKPAAQHALAGANAAVVGILLAALYHPVWTAAITSSANVALVLLAFGALQWWKLPAWSVVLAAALIGALAFG